MNKPTIIIYHEEWYTVEEIYCSFFDPIDIVINST